MFVFSYVCGWCLHALDISGNGLPDADELRLDLADLRRLRRLDVSRNPKLTPSRISSSFSWWKEQSEHPTLGTKAAFVGLADVGLKPEHVDVSVHGRNNLTFITCAQLAGFAI